MNAIEQVLEARGRATAVKLERTLLDTAEVRAQVGLLLRGTHRDALLELREVLDLETSVRRSLLRLVDAELRRRRPKPVVRTTTTVVAEPTVTLGPARRRDHYCLACAERWSARARLHGSNCPAAKLLSSRDPLEHETAVELYRGVADDDRRPSDGI